MAQLPSESPTNSGKIDTINMLKGIKEQLPSLLNALLVLESKFGPVFQKFSSDLDDAILEMEKVARADVASNSDREFLRKDALAKLSEARKEKTSLQDRINSLQMELVSKTKEFDALRTIVRDAHEEFNVKPVTPPEQIITAESPGTLMPSTRKPDRYESPERSPLFVPFDIPSSPASVMSTKRREPESPLEGREKPAPKRQRKQPDRPDMVSTVDNIPVSSQSPSKKSKATAPKPIVAIKATSALTGKTAQRGIPPKGILKSKAPKTTEAEDLLSTFGAVGGKTSRSEKQRVPRDNELCEGSFRWTC